MSQSPLSTAQRAPLSISFLIVGGGIAGLACSLALRRVGHDVTVLDKDLDVDGDGTDLGGVRIPPNGLKILVDWGLNDELTQIAKKWGGGVLFIYESGVYLGKQVLSDELFQDCRAGYAHVRHFDLRRLLYRSAVSAGVTVRWNTRVTDIDAGERTVTLASGEVLRAHIIVGADGQRGVARKHFKPEVTEDAGFLRMYQTTIPKELMMKDPDLAYFWVPKKSNVQLHAWCGNGRCAAAYCMPVGGPHSTEDFELYFHGPPDGTQGTWEDHAAMEEMRLAMKDAEPRLQKMMQLASQPRSRPVKHYVDMESWVHESMGMVLIGDAAHPIPNTSIQGVGLSLEDSAVLARLFSHLFSEEQIPRLLCAYEDLRMPRCRAVGNSGKDDYVFLTLPPGKLQERRDRLIRARDAAGCDLLEPGETDAAGVFGKWGGAKYFYGYDAEEAAENWWVQWGLLAIRAKATEAEEADSLNIQILDT